MAAIRILLIVMATISGTLAARKTRCDVDRALRAQAVPDWRRKTTTGEACFPSPVPDSDLRDWLCLVKSESDFRYDAVNVKGGDRGTYYGIFQLNSNRWCDKPSGTNGITCWRVNSNGCSDTCASFKDSDISNDANCAVRIKNCPIKRYGWRSRYRGRDLTSNSDYDYEDC